MLTQHRLPEDPRWNALHGVQHGDDNLLGMNMPPKVAKHQAKSKARPPAAGADHHYEYGEFGNPIADRWGKAVPGAPI
ncbi:hypothetical protein KCP78_09200 [Salmonella enterica subsp. enterica]|nr:hypothetical protein KCP78_09200 [Salmonella enterica subsp. enterica]